MKSTPWDRRFWASTRGRLILLLRRGVSTVNELAAELELSDNAVRTQLDRLERDGMAYVSGARPGVRKPNVTYGLSPEAERLFPKLYVPALRHLLDELRERLPAKKLDDTIQSVGRRLADKHRASVTAAKLEDRVAEVVAVLGEAGGGCQSEINGKIVIKCFDCPLSAAAVGHPEMCRLVEAMLAELIQTRVTLRCQADPIPKCCFEIDAEGT